MKRIAVVFEFATLHGGERSMLAALDQLPRDSFQVIAIAPAAGRLAHALQSRDIPVMAMQWRDGTGTPLPRPAVRDTLTRLLERCRADLVHANSLSMGRITGAIAPRLRAPCLAHLRDILRLSRKAVADLNGNHRLIAVSQATRQFHAAQGIDPVRTEVVYNGVDVHRFQPRDATGWLRDELRLPHSSFLVAAIGQICLRKGQDVLAEAAVRTASRLPDAHYVLVGARNSSKRESVEYETALMQRFAAAGIGHRLHLLGYRDDVAAIMNEVDLLVHAAHQEPMGRVLMEAAAAGLAIVATDVGGTGELLRDGHSARLVPAADPDALADAIREMHGDPTLRQQFAGTARSRVLRDFDSVPAARRLCDIWTDSLLGDRSET